MTAPAAPGAVGGDPVLAVTGVAGGAILERCAARRAVLRPSPFAPRPPAAAALAEAPDPPLPEPVPAPPPPPPPLPGTVPAAVRYLDLRAAGDEDFVVSAHAAILGRAPYEMEFNRRFRELQGGKSRLEILGRLALSREGRKALRPRAAGIALPALLRAARIADRTAARLQGTRALAALRAAVSRAKHGQRR